MQPNSLRRRRVICALGITFLLVWGSPLNFGQVNSGPSAVSLVARLESVSITARLSEDVRCTASGRNERRVSSVSLAASWALPTNRTIVRIIENNTPVFAQVAGESGRPERRIQQLEIALACDRSEEQDPEIHQRKVVISVEAF